MGVGKRGLAGLTVVVAGIGLLAGAVLAPRQWLTDPSRDAGRALAMTAASLLVVAGILDRVALWWALRWRRAALRGRWRRLLAVGELLARPAVATALFALAAPPYGVMGQLPAMVDDVAFGLVAAALVVVVIRWLDAERHRDDGSPSDWPAPARGARRRPAS